jgi:hypothetical protein
MIPPGIIFDRFLITVKPAYKNHPPPKDFQCTGVVNICYLEDDQSKVQSNLSTTLWAGKSGLYEEGFLI